MTRVTCVQLAPRVGALAENTAASVAAVRSAIDGGADVVVLPELVTSGYVFASADEARSLAVTPAHDVFAQWSAAAARRGAVVVGGFCEEGTDGRLHNSAAVVDASGVRAVYRKVHLWDREKLVFTAGDRAAPVIDTPHGRVGVAVCYDLEFPEWARALALTGADLVVVPTNWPLVPRPAGERPPEVVVAMAAARVNRVAVACADRTGTERGTTWTEGTSIISADGWVVAAAGAGAGVASADLDLTASRRKAVTPLAHVLDDRRPELYGPLASPGQSSSVAADSTATGAR